MLTLFGRFDRTSDGASDAALWGTLQALALASINDERLSVAYAAAFSVTQAAATVSADDETELYLIALARIADDPRVEVRSAIARDGIALMKRALSPAVRMAAETIVAKIRDDDNAQVLTLLQRAELRESDDRSPVQPSKAPTTLAP
jgi:hypothetical protein